MSFFAFKILYCQKIGCFHAKKRLDAFFFEKMPPFYFEKKRKSPFCLAKFAKITSRFLLLSSPSKHYQNLKHFPMVDDTHTKRA